MTAAIKVTRLWKSLPSLETFAWGGKNNREYRRTEKQRDFSCGMMKPTSHNIWTTSPGEIQKRHFFTSSGCIPYLLCAKIFKLFPLFLTTLQEVLLFLSYRWINRVIESSNKLPKFILMERRRTKTEIKVFLNRSPPHDYPTTLLL